MLDLLTEYMALRTGQNNQAEKQIDGRMESQF